MVIKAVATLLLVAAGTYIVFHVLSVMMNGDVLGVDFSAADRAGLWALGRGRCR